MAKDPAEVAALDARYTAAMTDAASNGTTSIAAELELETRTRSRVAISRDSSEVYRLAQGDNQLYATYYNLTEAGARVPSDSNWDSKRLLADIKMFPYYHGEVRFGALTLDDEGILHYGDCHLIMKTAMIDFRTTVFTENTAAFVSAHKPVPKGHRATWAQRGRLAVAKLVSDLTSLTKTADLPAILKRNRKTSRGKDLFLEAHLYGSVSIRTVERVGYSVRKRPAIRFGALKERLDKLPVLLVKV